MRGDFLRRTVNLNPTTIDSGVSVTEESSIALPNSQNRPFRNRMPVGKMSELMFPQGVVDTPFWFSNIGGNHFPREGFTYRPYDLPVVPFNQQMTALEQDDDVLQALSFVISKITGGKHYWKGKNENFVEEMTKFSKMIDTDEFSRLCGIELLWAGNSFWKVRGNRHISEIESFDELMHLPLDSMSRIWWTPDRIPLWYEFRGANFNGYFRADEILHFKWNPINASVFGLGYATPLLVRIPYYEDSINGPREKIRESLLDMKYGTQNNLYKSQKRYITRNVYTLLNSTPQERGSFANNIADLEVNQDIVVGKGVTVTELGSQARNYNPAQYLDLVMGGVMKSLQNYRARQAGESQHSFANAEQAAELDEIGLASFPNSFTRQMENKIFKPWYIYNGFYDSDFAFGLSAVPWSDTGLELAFGQQIKKDLTPEQTVAFINALKQSNSITWREIRKASEAAGMPLDADQEGEIEDMQAQAQQMEEERFSKEMEQPQSPKAQESYRRR